MSVGRNGNHELPRAGVFSRKLCILVVFLAFSCKKEMEAVPVVSSASPHLYVSPRQALADALALPA